jgi:magnesium-protoporphyrin IX monomethyl ester (oxidative) cyclase
VVPEWCNDEFRHGEAFALLMKTDPKLTSGKNVWWIKFFLTAVYSTMYVRDHQRPAFHKALGVDPDWYAHEVFTKTSEAHQQIFPITLDIDHPRWQRGWKALQRPMPTSRRPSRHRLWFETAAVRGLGAAARAFVSLMLIPSKKHEVPQETRMEPVY